MTEITASAVKSLRARKGAPLMKCKKALQEAGGDEGKAAELLRIWGIDDKENADSTRETSEGRFGVYSDFDNGVAAMIELQCESAPVANHEEFAQLAADLAQQFATGPGATTPAELLAQSSPRNVGITLQDQWDDLFLRIREKFVLKRIIRINAPCGAYTHRAGVNNIGVLVEVEGGRAEIAKDVAMHVAASNPLTVNTEDLDPTLVAKEREFLAATAGQQDKPENIIEKMIDGGMRKFFKQRVLSEQEFVKDNRQTVGQYAESAGMKLVRFIHWELGQRN